MITLAQLRSAEFTRAIFHFTGRHACSVTIGPRGGYSERITRARTNGRLQTWKTRPADFRLPVVRGMRDYGSITPDNAQFWHAEADCPARFGAHMAVVDHS